MTGQGFGVTNIHQTQDHLQGVDELGACHAAAFDSEAEDAGGMAASYLLAGGVMGAILQRCVIYPTYFGVLLQMVGQLKAIFTMPFYPKAQGFQSLQDQEGTMGGRGRHRYCAGGPPGSVQ